MTLLDAAGPGAWIQLLTFFGGLLWAVVAAGLLAFRWKVPPVVAVAPLVVQPLSAALGTSWLAWRTADLSALSRAEQALALAVAADGVVANGTLLLAAIPIALLLGLGGLIAGLQPPRWWWAPAGMAPFLGFVSLLPLFGLLWDAPLPLVLGQVAFGLLFSIPMSLAFANAHPKGNGTEGAMTASAAWIAAVGAFEIAKWSAANTLPEEAAGLGKEALQLLSGREGLRDLSWFCFALTLVPAIFAWFRTGPDLTEEEMLAGLANPSPWRGIGVGMALLTWLAWAIAMSACDPGKLLERIQDLL